MMQKIQDGLVQNIQTDSESFKILYYHYLAPVKALVLSRLCPKLRASADPSSITQSTIRSVFSDIVKPEKAVSTITELDRRMFQKATSRTTDVSRKLTNEKRDVYRNVDVDFELTNRSQEDPSWIVMYQDLMEQAVKMLPRIEKDDLIREAFHLVMSGYRISEAADAFGIPRHKARVRIRAIQVKIKRALGLENDE